MLKCQIGNESPFECPDLETLATAFDEAAATGRIISLISDGVVLAQAEFINASVRVTAGNKRYSAMSLDEAKRKLFAVAEGA